MSRPSAVLALVVAAVLTLGGCGVPSDDAPRALPLELVPTSTPTAAPTAAPSPAVTEQVALYVVAGDRLARTEVEVPSPAGARGALLALVGQGAVPAGSRTALPNGTTVLQTLLVSGTLTVDLSGELRGVIGDELRLAVAQLVFTATEFPSVEAVRLRVDGLPVQVPGGDAVLSGSPLTREQYADLAPA